MKLEPLSGDERTVIVPPICIDDLARDVEAEPGAADAAGHRRVETVELLEDPVELGGGMPIPSSTTSRRTQPGSSLTTGRLGRRRAST